MSYEVKDYSLQLVVCNYKSLCTDRCPRCFKKEMCSHNLLRPEEKIHRKPNKIRGKDPTLAFETGPLRLSRLRVVKVLWQKLFCPVSTLVHWFHPGFVQRAAGNGLRFATGWGWGFSESPRLDPTDRLDLASSTCRPRTWQRDAGVMFGDFFSTVVKPRMINHPQNPPVVL